jgi:P27 family predicted phage terminase small subunit
MTNLRKPKNSRLLGKYGRAKWKDLAPLMRTTAGEVDWDLLENYCLNYQMTNMAADEIQQIGVTVINSAGTRAANPANALMVSTQKHLVVLAKELNLTELAKHRNNMESPEDDGWD